MGPVRARRDGDQQALARGGGKESEKTPGKCSGEPAYWALMRLYFILEGFFIPVETLPTTSALQRSKGAPSFGSAAKPDLP